MASPNKILRIERERNMSTEIIVAIIAGGAAVVAAIITGIFNLFGKKSKATKEQKIQGNNNIQAGENVHIVGGVSNNAKTDNKRKL